MTGFSINPQAKALEDAFFARENARLLAKLREKAQHQERREALRSVLPNADDAFLDHLLDLNLRPETALAVVMVPLVLVAWADGVIDQRERDAIMRAAEQRGLVAGTPAWELLESWLSRKPEATLFETWKSFVRALWGHLEPAEQRAVHDRMLAMARQVAEAAGGFLGLTSKISPAERAVLEELEKALG